MTRAVLTVLLCLIAAACGSTKSSPTAPSPSPSPSPTPGPTPGSPAIFRDTFTASVGQGLTFHKPDRGDAWILNEDTTGGRGAFIVAPGADWLTPNATVNGRVSYYALPQPAVPDYYVELSLDNQAEGSSNFFAWIMLRRTDPGTYYGAGWYAAAVPNDCYIFRVVSGVYTQLANADCGFTGQGGANASIIRFAVAGDSLTLFKNGGPVLSAAGGNAITAAGAGGVGAGNIRAQIDAVSTGLAMDDLSIVELR